MPQFHLVPIITMCIVMIVVMIDVKEHLRVVQAAQYAAKHGEVCPMDWNEGDATMKGNFDSKKDYFTNKRKKRA